MPSLWAVLLLFALLAPACGEKPVLLLTVGAEVRVDTYDLLVQRRSDRTVVLEIVNAWVDLANPKRDISQPGQELRLALRFARKGRYLVHVIGRSPDATQVSTRVFSVQGAEEGRLDLVDITGHDLDGDGFVASEDCTPLFGDRLDCTFSDCDDADPERHPLARDLCDDGVDADCDGVDPVCTDRDGDGSPDFEDCDDSNPDRFPGNPEPPNRCPTPENPAGMDRDVCEDGIDQDCDGQDTVCIPDRDCDGSSPPADCDDSDPGRHPGAVEICGNDLDENCNGEPDDGCADCDLDGDGFEREDSQRGCPTAFYPVGQGMDCNDHDAGIFPGSTMDCGGQEGGHSACGLLQLCDGRDNDCDGEIDEGCPEPACDEDGDGFAIQACGPPPGLADCDDDDPWTFPGAPDHCGDGVLQNCNADTPCSDDLDSDGYNASVDCDDTNEDIHPFALERCNGLDDDCDGWIDEGNPDAVGDPLGELFCTDDNDGLCGVDPGPGRCVCSRLTPRSTRDEDNRTACPDEDLAAQASPRCFLAPQPSLELCDPVDHDCDGRADAPDGANLSEAGQSCGSDVGACVAGVVEGCDLATETTGALNPNFVCSQDFVPPLLVELCNGFDDDCDGTIPSGEQDVDSDGYLACSGCEGLELAPGMIGCDDCDPLGGGVDNCGGGTPHCCFGLCTHKSSDVQNCGECGNVCDALRADNCHGGSCRCGNGAICAAGSRCVSGACVCDSTSCAQGCCESGVCYAQPDQLHCGIQGGPCVACYSPNVCITGYCDFPGF